MTDRLQFAIRTPHACVFEQAVSSARVPVASGQVGLRPRQEPLLLTVEPGLIVLRAAGAISFAATAGGLLEGDRERSVLYTPFAAVGEAGDELLAELERALAAPGSEVDARRRLGELEQRIVEEVRRRPPATRIRRDGAGV